MSRERRFFLDIKVRGAALAADEATLAGFVRRQLEQMKEARGPRGGRYLLFGPIEYCGTAQVEDDFIRDLWTFRAARMGRYVRPKP